MSDLFQIKKQGFLMGHSFVNCQIELEFPNIQAQYILQNFGE